MSLKYDKSVKLSYQYDFRL